MNGYRCRKNLPEEFKALQYRMRELLQASMGERQRTEALLRETELKLEEKFGHMDSLETIREKKGKKFRKRPALPADAGVAGIKYPISDIERSISDGGDW